MLFNVPPCAFPPAKSPVVQPQRKLCFNSVLSEALEQSRSQVSPAPGSFSQQLSQALNFRPY